MFLIGSLCKLRPGVRTLSAQLASDKTEKHRCYKLLLTQTYKFCYLRLDEWDK